MVAKNFFIPTYFTVLLFTSCFKLIITTSVSPNLHFLRTVKRLRRDSEALQSATTDYGNIVKQIPAAVLYPSSINDIKTLIKLSYNSAVQITVAAKGRGHSVRGQAMAKNGVVVDMISLNDHKKGSGVRVSGSPSSGFYADVGGEQLWINVLNATLKYGLSPVSFTDYLFITVGGTLSNAGIGGQTFRYGPQISNVYQMDIITGKGDLLTCSAKRNSELFHAVLGGLGQFGIITSARIALAAAPKRVKWVRMLYKDFSEFCQAQERLILIDGRRQEYAVNYLEGLVFILNGSPENWRSSYFPPSHQSRIASLLERNSIIYCLELAKYYDDQTKNNIDKELEKLYEGLNFIPGFVFEKDVSYADFLNRVHSEELKLQSQGLWEVPHPWLNLFVPKSRISDFNEGVFKNILLRRNITTGAPILIYPMNRNEWDERTSAVIPEEEEVFYAVGVLNASGDEEWEAFDDQNEEIVSFCANAGIKFRQYLCHYRTNEEWKNHFGSKWESYRERKMRFDPRMMLSPGQRIFNV